MLRDEPKRAGEPVPAESPTRRGLWFQAESITAASGCWLLRLSGCLDASTAPALTARVDEYSRQGGIRLIFDLGRVFYLSSTGIDCFTMALKAVKPRGGDIVLVGLHERVRGVLQMYGFDKAFTTRNSVTDAISLLSSKTASPPPGRTRAQGRAAPPQSNVPILPPVQVFGQLELVEHLEQGGAHHTHCVSIGNPRRFFGKSGPDTKIPPILRRSFRQTLRLEFYDVLERRHLRRWQFPKRIPRQSDVRKAIHFFRKTRDRATGYTIHCWQGVSRSTGFALGFLYMLTNSEEEAKRLLQKVRPEAGPHPKIVQWFDDELGCNLSAVNARIRAERIEKWKRELELTLKLRPAELPVSHGDEP